MLNPNATSLRSLVSLTAFALLLPLTARADDKTCGPQDYQSENEPDYECPSPGETVFVPESQMRPSLGVPSGSVLRLKGSSRFRPVRYDAILMDKLRAMHLGLRIVALRKLRYLDGQTLRSECLIQEAFTAKRQDTIDKLHQAQKDKLKNNISHLNQLLAQKERKINALSAWWRSPLLWFGAGASVVLGSLAILVIAN